MLDPYWSIIPPSSLSDMYILKTSSNRFGVDLRFSHVSYAARLDRLGAETLELRRLTSDLTIMFSIFPGFVDIDCNIPTTQCGTD